MKSCLVVLAALAAAAAPLSALQDPKNPPAGDAPRQELKIGAVNLKECFDKNNYEYVKDVENDLAKVNSANQGEIDRIQKKMRDLQEKLTALDRNHPLRDDLLRQYKTTETELEVTKKILEARYLERAATLQTEVYNEMRRVINVVADEGKFDLVLRVEEPQLSDEGIRDASQKIAMRVVLFAGPKLDMTKTVLARLNQEYAKIKAAKPLMECAGCRLKGYFQACPKCKGATKAALTKTPPATDLKCEKDGLWTPEEKCPVCGEQLKK